ncbi:MAG TPA: archease [Polyangiaceae bacterium]
MPHTLEDHVGEVQLRLGAASLPGVFEEAARALAELMCAEGGEPEGEPVPVRIGAPDREALLAAWIDELVFLSETHKRVWVEARIERLTDRELVAVVRGFEPAALRTQVKAATLHGLTIRETDDGRCEATVVLDV